MAQFEQLGVGELTVGNGYAKIIAGAKVTQATVYAERAAVSQMGALDADPIGTMYIGNNGSTSVIYLRVAKAGAAADWYLVTTSNA
jgi:hypothetical protein